MNWKIKTFIRKIICLLWLHLLIKEVILMVNIFKKDTNLWELKKLKIVKWETINTIKKLIGEKEHKMLLEIFIKLLLTMPFFNRDRIFTICKIAKLSKGTYLYWVEQDSKKINGRFLRQELFAWNNQFLRWELF